MSPPSDDRLSAACTFEETMERMPQAIRLGVIGPGGRLPPERELSPGCASRLHLAAAEAVASPSPTAAPDSTRCATRFR